MLSSPYVGFNRLIINRLLFLRCLIVLDRRLHEGRKQRRGLQHRTLVLRMEHRSDKPGVPCHLDDLYQARLGVHTHGLHAGSLKLLAVVEVELVVVEVTLDDRGDAISRSRL